MNLQILDVLEFRFLCMPSSRYFFSCIRPVGGVSRSKFARTRPKVKACARRTQLEACGNLINNSRLRTKGEADVVAIQNLIAGRG